MSYKAIMYLMLNPPFPPPLIATQDGELSGGGKLDILLDTGASKSYMSKAFYM